MDATDVVVCDNFNVVVVMQKKGNTGCNLDTDVVVAFTLAVVDDVDGGGHGVADVVVELLNKD